MPTSNALATLLKLQSPSNMNSTGDAYVDRRRSDIVSGMDEYAPSELDQRMVQANLGDQGMGVSRDMVRESGIQQGVSVARAQQEKLRQLLLPEQVKGEYAVRAATERGKTQGDLARQSQAATEAGRVATSQATDARQERGISAAADAAEKARQFRGSQISPATTAAIARQRQALQAAAAKSEPNALFKMFGKTNPGQAAVDTFDNTLGYAEKIMREFPDASAEEALATMGEQPSPQELGQIQQFLLMLRGQ